MTDAEPLEEACGGHTGGTRTIEHDRRRVDRTPGQVERVEESGSRDDCGAVLVVVEHGDAEAFLECVFDLEALRCPNVLEVDTSHGGFEHLAESDDVGRLRCVDLDVEDVDVGEAFEQDTLAFHDGLACERTDIAEPQHRGAIADDCDEIALVGVPEYVVRISGYLETRFGNTRRVCETEVALCRCRLGGNDLCLAGSAFRVVFESFTEMLAFWHHTPPP